jgi:hypothetical protein
MPSQPPRSFAPDPAGEPRSHDAHGVAETDGSIGSI